ncbi:hypothetical protein FL966_03550 [Caproiciproducens galactitolivorans]|jgi:hypothetical protein|uniref:Uncharacterized protein n=1 Tax=Caproiciproducens galactitolivorans TaxID=642589 RepID=A0A4Z0YK70_9FIRM|nr:hypothetical protein [Caproiciproducens galactitolivorans]QEY34198.1 hypothetical protein FL966_03550 [Caproiciproducens galactitolivorans]TGJ78046.1 hypothetical protein CAGA_04580 [Caproiciproducens galactitolivorans]
MKRKSRIGNEKFLIASFFIALPIIVAACTGYLCRSSFWYAYMGYCGTTFLGFVAFFQNELRNKDDADLNAADTLCPFLEVSKIIGKDKKEAVFEDNHYVAVNSKSAKVFVRNIGQGIASGLTYEPKMYLGGRPTIRIKDDETKCYSVQAGDVLEIALSVAGTEKNINKLMEQEIFYQNIIGYRYSQIITYKLVEEFDQTDEEECSRTVNLYIYNMSSQKRLGMEDKKK